MPSIPYYQIDAFTDSLFKGNPAGVCPLNSWLDTTLMQQIAFENNLSETAFYVAKNDVFEIRWFTPTVEVALCGHATLAAAFVEFNLRGTKNQSIVFENTNKQKLKVSQNDDLITLDFPADVAEPMSVKPFYEEAFGYKPLEALDAGTMLILTFKDEQSIQKITPNLELVSKLPYTCVIVTAPGTATDVVCRVFAPQSGINEDPVTGSAHTKIIPYWSKKLNKEKLTSAQLSERSGFLSCAYHEDRVTMSGKAQLYLSGQIHL